VLHVTPISFSIIFRQWYEQFAKFFIMEFPPSCFKIPLCGPNIPPPPHLILGISLVYSLRLGPETTFHAHKIGFLVRNVEILNGPSVIHSECLQLLFLHSIVYQGILKLLMMSSKLWKVNIVEWDKQTIIHCRNSRTWKEPVVVYFKLLSKH